MAEWKEVNVERGNKGKKAGKIDGKGIDRRREIMKKQRISILVFLLCLISSSAFGSFERICFWRSGHFYRKIWEDL